MYIYISILESKLRHKIATAFIITKTTELVIKVTEDVSKRLTNSRQCLMEEANTHILVPNYYDPKLATTQWKWHHILL